MSFPLDFVWGAATSSYQIEGAAYEDEKGLSVWDLFCKQPGRIFEGHTGETACDHYHHFKEDVGHMKNMGVQAYRFSVSWPRILPEGTGRINQKGVDFYKRLADELIEKGITPYLTLFHWDYPQALFERGAWLNKNSSDWFAEYAGVVAKELGDQVKHYFTLNEPQCFISQSYSQTKQAPGIVFPRKDVLQMAHNVMLAHGKAVMALRENIADCIVGYAPTGTSYYPISDKPTDIEAARKASFTLNEDWGFSIAWWSDPVMLGKYPDNTQEIFREDMPRFSSDDMKIISQPLDMYGQNIYHSIPVRGNGKGGWETVSREVGHAKTAIGWPVTPECLYWTPRFLYDRYRKPIIITENGMSSHDWIDLDGKVKDTARIDFLHRHLQELMKVVGEGVPVKGYFHWSLLDNFEWSEGYNDRFGLIYVDYQTQKRVWKDSAYWYRDVINSNGDNLNGGIHCECKQLDR